MQETKKDKFEDVFISTLKTQWNSLILSWTLGICGHLLLLSTENWLNWDLLLQAAGNVKKILK